VLSCEIRIATGVWLHHLAKKENFVQQNSAKFLMISSGITIVVLVISGCASAPARPVGAVLPLENGRFQHSIKGMDEPGALKTLAHDAEITCNKTPAGPRMPWQAPPPPAKYVVVSQSIKNKDGKQIKSSDNKALDAGIAVGLRKFGLEGQDSVEVTTIFKCE